MFFFGLGWSQRPVGRESLPDAKSLVDRHVQESGGWEALQSVRTLIVRGRISFAELGVSGKVTVYEGEEGETYQVMELPGAGKVETGNNGDVEWERSTIAGPKIVRVASVPGGLLRPSALRGLSLLPSVKMETIGLDRVDGRPCYQVRLSPPAPLPAQTQCYDRDSGFLTRTSLSIRLGDSTMQVVTVLRDYRDTGPVKNPFVTETQMPGQSFRIDSDSVHVNEPLPPEALDLPEDIRILAARKKDDMRTLEPEDDPDRPKLRRKKKR